MLVVDAVCEAVSLRLPALIESAVRGNLAPAVAPAAVAAIRELQQTFVAAAVAETMQAQEARVSEFRQLDEATLAQVREELARAKGEFDDRLRATAAAIIGEQRQALLASAVAETMQAHEERIGEFRRFDETVLAKMREELDRLRVEFDDGLQKHYAEVRRELSHETATTLAGALSNRMQGPPGPPGRDGTLAPSIHWKEGLHVAAGACVQHRGGLWFANADSDVEPGAACSGYSLLLDGCEPSTIEPDERGFLFVVYRFASGLEKRLPLNYRPMQDAGVWDADRDYLPNDFVSYGGSLWIARVGHFARRPGTDTGGAAWRLAVKCGKDGKDGEPGPQGPAGERGPPGEPPPPPPRKRAVANGGAS